MCSGPVSLETADFADATCKITSPRSLEACRQCGARLGDLYTVPLEEFTKCGNTELAEFQHKACNEKRKLLLAKVRKAREKLVGASPKVWEGQPFVAKYEKHMAAVARRAEAAEIRNQLVASMQTQHEATHKDTEATLRQQRKLAKEKKQRQQKELRERVRQGQLKKNTFLDAQSQEREAYVAKQSQRISEKDERICETKKKQEELRLEKVAAMKQKYECFLHRREHHKSRLREALQQRKQRMERKYHEADSHVQESESRRMQCITERMAVVASKQREADEKREKCKEHELQQALSFLKKEEKSEELLSKLHNERVNHKAYTLLLQGLKSEHRQQIVDSGESALLLHQNITAERQEVAVGRAGRVHDKKLVLNELRKTKSTTRAVYNTLEKQRLERVYTYKQDCLRQDVGRWRARANAKDIEECKYRAFLHAVGSKSASLPACSSPGPGAYLPDGDPACVHHSSPSAIIGQTKRAIL